MDLGTSPVVQWISIHLPMQGTRIQLLVQKTPRAMGQRNPCITTTEPVLWRLETALLEDTARNLHSTARSQHRGRITHRSKSSPRLPKLEKSLCKATKTHHNQKKVNK